LDDCPDKQMMVKEIKNILEAEKDILCDCGEYHKRQNAI
tara:strand:- start:2245 stop:2361 length:117 start_codon:yes stop_codon:yes gene_type:complete